MLFQQAMLFFATLFFSYFNSLGQATPYEIRGKNYTATYEECIAYYSKLDRKYREIKMFEMGETDAGIPLHLVLVSADASFDPGAWKEDEKIVILINNGIHPGEPDGIDASMMLLRDLMEQSALPENVVLAIVPIYNIGGALQRSKYNRPDQNGPEEFGSRGNSQNLDLNRDFIKCDSKEARSFAEIFHWLNPQIFLDNHVSDGADYAHVMTMATTQHNKLGGSMGSFLKSKMEPSLFDMMKEKKFEMIPYCNVWGHDAKEGWVQFFDSPRYSSGYVTLFQTFGFVPETHMLKPYPHRVEATYAFMQCMINYASNQHSEIDSVIQQARLEIQNQKIFPLQWKVDSTHFEKVVLNGYEYETRKSEVSGLPVKFYNRDKPYRREVKFFNQFVPAVSVEAPLAYIVPRGWWKVVELLRLNGVEMFSLTAGEKFDVEKYTIRSYKSSATPFEHHHLNSQVETEAIANNYIAMEGDWYIPVSQDAKRFIIEVLEPKGGDSYFVWNYFDAVLIQKEGYSDYAYESVAAQYLQEHPDLKRQLEEKCKTDKEFAANPRQQLEFIYKKSPSYESRHNIYPVMRVMNSGKEFRHDEGKHPESKMLNKHDE